MLYKLFLFAGITSRPSPSQEAMSVQRWLHVGATSEASAWLSGTVFLWDICFCIWAPAVDCKAKSQYLLTLQVRRYCILARQISALLCKVKMQYLLTLQVSRCWLFGFAEQSCGVLFWDNTPLGPRNKTITQYWHWKRCANTACIRVGLISVAMEGCRILELEKDFLENIRFPHSTLYPSSPTRLATPEAADRSLLHQVSLLHPTFLVMFPLYRGGDIMLHLSPLICSSDLLFCVCAFSTSILQAVKQETFLCLCVLSVYHAGGQTRLLLAHCLQRSANISPVLGCRVVFDATLNVGQRHRWRANINPALVQSYSDELPYEYMLALCTTDTESESDEATSRWPFVRPDPCLSSKHRDRTANMQVPFVCMALMIVPAGTKCSPAVGTVLSHRLRLDRRCTGVGWTYILFCCDDDGCYCSVDSTHWPSVDLVPGRRRRRRTGIESASGLFLLFAGWSDDEII